MEAMKGKLLIIVEDVLNELAKKTMTRQSVTIEELKTESSIAKNIAKALHEIFE